MFGGTAGNLRLEWIHHNLLVNPYEYWSKSSAVVTPVVLAIDHGPPQLPTLSWSRAPG